GHHYLRLAPEATKALADKPGLTFEHFLDLVVLGFGFAESHPVSGGQLVRQLLVAGTGVRGRFPHQFHPAARTGDDFLAAVIRQNPAVFSVVLDHCPGPHPDDDIRWTIISPCTRTTSGTESSRAGRTISRLRRNGAIRWPRARIR